jgi:glucan biosynthesis protein C
METKLKVRRHDIDWLRVLGMLTIFLFHCARYFDFDDWHVKNPQLSEGFTIFIGVVAQWIMPLFFVLSALGVTYALRSRSNREYLNERARRLLIPLFFGILFLIPHQVYIERVTHDQFSGTFLQFIPHYFDGLYAFGGNFAWMGLHLWYLLMLFLFSLITLPLFRQWQAEPGQIRMRLNQFLAKPGAIFLAAIPIALVEVVVNLCPETVGRRDFGGWSPLTYLAVFVVGYWVARHDELQEAIYKYRWWAAGLGLLATASGYILIESGASSYSASVSILRGFNTWFWLVGILGLGRQYLSFQNNSLKYANQEVLPFYILHQSVIVLVGYWLLGWSAPVLIKYFVLASISFTIIMLLYEFIVRRVRILRPLFGMKSSA